MSLGITQMSCKIRKGLQRQEGGVAGVVAESEPLSWGRGGTCGCGKRGSHPGPLWRGARAMQLQAPATAARRWDLVLEYIGLCLNYLEISERYLSVDLNNKEMPCPKYW